DLLDMAEGDARQPVDADMDVGGGLLAAGDVEVAAARRARADEDGVVAFLEQRLHAVDALAEARVDAEVHDVADLLVDHRLGQAEARYLGADHAARLGIAVIDDDVIAGGQEVARNGQRSRAGADQGDALAVLLLRCGRQPRAYGVLVIGGDALQAADRHRLVLDAAAPEGRLARPVAGPAEDAGEDVRRPVDHIGVAVALRRDQPDVFGYRGVGRAGPLAVDHLVEIIGNADVGRLHRLLLLTLMFQRVVAGRGRRTRGRRIRRPMRRGQPRAGGGAMVLRCSARGSISTKILLGTNFARPTPRRRRNSGRKPSREPCRHSSFPQPDQPILYENGAVPHLVPPLVEAREAYRMTMTQCDMRTEAAGMAKRRKDTAGGNGGAGYRDALLALQIELVKLQREIIGGGRKILVIIEGRDAAGKDGTIKAITQHLSPRETRVVALGKPSERDVGSWYFRRFVAHLPAAQEMVIFNRSWYNRAGVERVMGFCTKHECEEFLETVP